ncbi:MAG TPA: dihydroxyacetone kinase phosphoryl donor subunit DhaM [Actinomycetota bacterium]|nr:dihydroxyacetone kinase phosphoryl donor subunit DhaM [Actinomycetota bacterium]
MSTVGIVLVSHSPKLAAGLADLLAQVASDGVPVAVAGGTSDGRLGTDPDRIREAVAEVDRGDGVVVIPDLGSAVLAVKSVLEFLDGEVVLVDAPFVEGAVSAAVIASTGAPLDAVADAARQARDVPKL